MSSILHLHRLPARLTSEQAAEVLGFQPHDIPVLIAKEKITPLGRPAPSAPKYFAACEIQEKAQDTDWLNEASRAISDCWKRRNAKRKGNLQAAR